MHTNSGCIVVQEWHTLEYWISPSFSLDEFFLGFSEGPAIFPLILSLAGHSKGDMDLNRESQGRYNNINGRNE